MMNRGTAPRTFEELEREMEEMINFLRAAGSAEFDEVIKGAERDLAKARMYVEDGLDGATQWLAWAVRPLERFRLAMTKPRRLSEVAGIVGCTPGHLHNLAAEGKVRPAEGGGVRRISLLDFRAQRTGPARGDRLTPARKPRRKPPLRNARGGRPAAEPASIFSIS